MVKTKSEYNESYAKFTEEEMLKKKLIYAQRALERIQKLINNAA
jgi:hypothetical protein